MKMISIVSLLLFSLFPKQDINIRKNVHFNYMGFETWNKNSRILYFCIENNTSDTIYLSWYNIKVEVKRGALILKEDPWAPHGFPPPLENERLQQPLCKDSKAIKMSKQRLTAQFARLLFDKNFSESHINQADKKYILQTISINCIVLLPHSTTSYESYFNSKVFDKSCIGIAKEVKTNVFSSFEPQDGKRRNIFY